MKNRLEASLKEKKKAGRKVFCAYITLGFPTLEFTRELIPRLEKAGTDILELGFPFSDPMADGPTIQASSEHALRQGVRMQDAFKLVRELRGEGLRIPVIFFSYFNPVYHFGIERFVKAAAAAGFDGIILPDLPPDEEKGFRRVCHEQGLSQVFLIAPTTGPERTAMIARASSGFIYYVSLKGVTGARAALPADVSSHLRKIKKVTSKPVLVGFGVSTPEQARQLSRSGDGVIVGSALIECIRKSEGKTAPVERFVKKMVQAMKEEKHAGPARR